MRFILIKKRWFVFGLLLFCLAVGFTWYTFNPQVVQTETEESLEREYTINMVTGEFKSKTEDGKELEAYRWDPGTIYIPKDEHIKLSIYGVNGSEHPFIIEGTTIKGTVKKGKETVVDLHFTKEGVYRLICLTHPDIEHNGPMIAYIVVD